MSLDLDPQTRIRWNREGDLGEYGTVSVTRQVPEHALSDLFKFAAVGRRRDRYHHFRDERTKEYGGDRERINDGGPVAGLVLRFDSRTQIVHGRTAQDCKQMVTKEVATALFDAGAAEVSAE